MTLILRENNDYQDKAKRVVREYAAAHFDKSDKIQLFDVYVVWFAKTLNNFKALLSTSLPDGRYYEVTYNGGRGETYLDVYIKFDNVCIED